MANTLDDIEAFLAVARAGGFRKATGGRGASASALSEAVRRLEGRLGVRLLHRTTRSVGLTEAGRRLSERLGSALAEVGAALDEAASLADQPAGALRLNVPVSAARLSLPRLLPPFLAAHPRIVVEVTTQESFIDILAAGFDAGIRYEERLEQDMIAIPIGPLRQRFAAGASADYLARRGVPQHPGELARHACLASRFGAERAHPWEFERGSESVRLDPAGPLLVQAGGGSDLAVDAAIAGAGVVYLFEDWLRPYFERGALTPVLEDWWPSFSGPFLYYSGRRLVPPPLRAFIDFVRAAQAREVHSASPKPPPVGVTISTASPGSSTV
jgi:DNA-binding transcriptional LysR family regulator